MRIRWFIAILGVVLAACGSTGPYVWVDSLPPQAASQDVIIAEGDNLNVRVLNQEPLSGQQRVRPDGKIALPLVGEVVARGKRPAQLSAEIQDRLKSYIQVPTVVVTMEGGGDLKVSVVGEVKTAGIYQLDRGSSVLTALAAAGGLNDYADSDRIFVVRRSLPQRVRFRFNNLRSADPRSIQFGLQAGDVVVVE